MSGAGRSGREEFDIPMPSMAPSYRVQTRGRIDPNTKRLALIAAVIGGSLLALVGAWSLQGRRHGGVPVVEADPRPLRVKPVNPGGLEVVGEDDASVGGATSGPESLAPPPEAPAPQALKAQQEAAPISASPPEPSEPASSAKTAARIAAPAAAAPAEPSATPPPSAATEPHPVPRLIAKPAAQAAGGLLVQLAAVQSEPAALSEWQRLSKKMPDLLGSRRPVVVKVDQSGKTFWRLRTGGFADTAEATGFCLQIRAKGAACSIASF